MKKLILGTFAILLLPTMTYAQSLQEFLPNFMIFVNTKLIPFLLGIAFLFFVVNAILYFVIGSTIESIGDYGKKSKKSGDRGAAKALAKYGISAFVIIIIFWGIINMLVSSLGFTTGPGAQPPSDYVDQSR